MATVTLKNLPEPLVRQLKEQARRNRRSLSQEVLARLEASLVVPRRSETEVVDRLRRLHRRMTGMESLTDGLLERAKSEGRL